MDRNGDGVGRSLPSVKWASLAPPWRGKRGSVLRVPSVQTWRAIQRSSTLTAVWIAPSMFSTPCPKRPAGMMTMAALQCAASCNVTWEGWN